jgi:hypothetical protein
MKAATAQDAGAIKQWLVLGPLGFEGYNGAKALDQEQVAAEAALRPLQGKRSRVGDNDWIWQAVSLDDYRISFPTIFRTMAPSTVAYLVCYVESEADQAGLLMEVGSENQSKVYLNGNEIYRYDKPRKFVADQDVVSGIDLKKGVNVVMFKVVNEDDNWQASLRFTDAAGQPVKGIRVGLIPP